MSVPAPRSTRPPLLPLDEALAQLLGGVTSLGRTETVNTFDADGRVLAQELVSALQVPALDNSSMDGYAMRCADVRQAGMVLKESQRIAAGSQEAGAGLRLAAGTVARIFTGAPIPPGADAVVPQEECEAMTEPDGHVRIQQIPMAGQWIRRAGEDVRKGTTVLHLGHRLNPASLGLAASIGFDRLRVAARPRVALFSTGDELVMPGEVAPAQMRPGAIYNSNRFFLRAMLQRLGCDVTDCGIVPDQRVATELALATASQSHDLILTSGGVSVGEEDHIKPAVQALGTLDLWQIAIKPGKPFAHGRVGSAHFIGLPGNPVSSFVTFMLLVRPVILKLQGATALDRSAIPTRASFNWKKPDRRREFLRVRRNASGELELFENQSSGVLTSSVWGDGLVDVAPGRVITAGEPVPYLPFAELL